MSKLRNRDRQIIWPRSYNLNTIKYSMTSNSKRTHIPGRLETKISEYTWGKRNNLSDSSNRNTFFYIMWDLKLVLTACYHLPHPSMALCFSFISEAYFSIWKADILKWCPWFYEAFSKWPPTPIQMKHHPILPHNEDQSPQFSYIFSTSEQIFNLHLQTWENNKGLQIAKQNFFYERKIVGEKKFRGARFHKEANVQTYHYIIREISFMKQELPDFKITIKPQKWEYSNDIE